MKPHSPAAAGPPCRMVKVWVLDALTMQAQLPVLNRPIKETNNNRKHREEVYSVGSYWEEEQIKTSRDTFLKSILGS